MKETISRLASRIRDQLQTQVELHREFDRIQQNLRMEIPNSPATYGYKVYSQCDEDGIIENIFSILGVEERIFVEIGCSDGLENNTHTLVLKGWRGIWIDADQTKIKSIKNILHENSILVVMSEYVSATNAPSLIASGLQKLQANTIDLLSIDIDGDDLYVAVAVLSVLRPRVLCVEYNAKFPPPIDICVREHHGKWSSDDYQGASLACFVRVLGELGYSLVACTLSGVNAFFVSNEYASKFPSFSPSQLYQPARYHLVRLLSGHRSTRKFLADAIAEQEMRRVHRRYHEC